MVDKRFDRISFPQWGFFAMDYVSDLGEVYFLAESFATRAQARSAAVAALMYDVRWMDVPNFRDRLMAAVRVDEQAGDEEETREFPLHDGVDYGPAVALVLTSEKTSLPVPASPFSAYPVRENSSEYGDDISSTEDLLEARIARLRARSLGE